MTYPTTKRVIILEGGDGAGKSTLAQELAARLDAVVVHHGPYLNDDPMQLANRYVDAMLPALLGERNVIMDRSWISELIYSFVCRDNENRVSIITQSMLERLALRCGAVMIICGTDRETQLANWEQRAGTGGEYVKKRDIQDQVWEAYKRGTRTMLPVRRYNYKEVSVIDSVDHIVDVWLNGPKMPGLHPLHSRGAGWFGSNTQIAVQRRILVVGDSFASLKRGEHEYRWPFASWWDWGCSRWLSGHVLGYENKLCWVNADQDLAPYLDRPWAGIVTLGQPARAAVSALTMSRFTSLVHPQYHKRFNSSEPYPLADVLKEMLSVK